MSSHNEKTKPSTGGYPDDNPKTAVGSKKPSLTKFPASALIYGALAMMNGAAKYGPYNWREKRVTASIYVDAAVRHLEAWFDGSDYSSDTNPPVPHLAHALASIAILIDALETGNLNDDRPLPGCADRLIDDWAKKIELARAVPNMTGVLTVQMPEGAASLGKFIEKIKAQGGLKLPPRIIDATHPVARVITQETRRRKPITPKQARAAVKAVLGKRKSESKIVTGLKEAVQHAKARKHSKTRKRAR